MTYLGNPTLPADVQQRIRSTFEHTLGLAEKGSRQEAMLGCDFVLRMDPQFEPARRLQERLDGAAGPVAVGDLRKLEAAGSTAALAPVSAGAADLLWSDLDGLASELPELPDLHAAGLQHAGTPAAIRAEFESLLAERRFQELQNRAEHDRAAVTGDLELQRIVSLAQERLEAAPYVSKFLLSARDALRAGNTVEAGRLVDKARALDPTHPGIAELTPAAAGPRGGIAAAPSASRTAAATPGIGGAAGTLYSPPDMQALPTPPAAGAAHAAGPEIELPYSAAGGDSDSELRIQQLLAAGQAALDGGDPQAAIDVWSRIFLIDIDHQEASRRIEQARRLKAERDRQVEETLHDGLAALEAHDAVAARGAFQHVLELQPGHLKAREYLQQLDEGVMPAGGGRAGAGRPAGGASTMLGAPGGATAVGAGGGGGFSGPGGLASPGAGAGGGTAGAAGLEADLQEEILVPPDIEKGAGRAGEARHEERSASAGAHEGRARRLFVVVGGCVLFLILVVGWFLYQKRETWFPNSRTEEPAQPPAPNPIPRATKLHNTGKVGTALTQLRHVAPGDPHYKEAQALIAKWQEEQTQGAAAPESGANGAAAGAAPGSPAAGGSAQGAPAAALSAEAQRRAALLDQAHLAFQEGIFLQAAERFGAADKLAKLDAADAGQFAAAKQHLVAIQREVAMFTGHDWEYALPVLWADHQTDPGNKDVTRMIVDCYYDLGVRDLQHGDVRKAGEKFTEAQHVAPDDPDVMRQLLFAQTYQGRDTDLLYRIYVKYLPIR